MTEQLENKPISDILDKALSKRISMLTPAHNSAVRLLNGFQEGIPDLVVDLFGSTLVLFSHHTDVTQALIDMRDVREFYLARLPWLTCVIEKHRNAMDELKPKGIMIDGKHPDTQITENGIHYALDLQLNKDASFYMDTRNLRQWITAHARAKTVLNTFAYTGSLGIAALGGGAAFVAQVDMNRNFLGLAHNSRALNGFDAAKMKLMPVDFFVAVGSLKREKALFDMVILDPPFFSTTERGRVNQAGESTRLINKARPTGGGWRLSHCHQQRSFLQRAGLHGRTGSVMPGRFPVARRNYPRAGGCHWLPGCPLHRLSRQTLHLSTILPRSPSLKVKRKS